MPKKDLVTTDKQAVEERYSPWLFQVIDQIAAAILVMIVGRGGGKTSNGLAERLMDICYDMPGANIALTADTYVNANENIVKTLREGWERLEWIEDIHFVIGKRPPKHFKKPYKPITGDYKHHICTLTGTVFRVVSQDRPSIAAGDSFQHVVADEARYLKKKKLDKLTPALRGGDYVRFAHSPYFMGKTIMTDMPDPLQGDEEWALEYAKHMDPEQIQLIFQAACVVNEIKLEILELEREGKSTVKAQKNLERWDQKWRKIRKKSIFIVNASSFVNVDILSIDYFLDSLIALGTHEFEIAILGRKPKPPVESLFYPKFNERWKFLDGYNYDWYDQFKLGNDIPQSCKVLKYLDRSKPLEGGFDAGNMMSLVLGQTSLDKKKSRVLKCMCTISPEWIEQLAAKFIEFFKDHDNKILELYHDRSANQYARAKKDFANDLKEAIEKKDGVMTGWIVRLKSRNQGNITQEQEYDLMIKIWDRRDKNLPEVLIDKYECRPLISSIENTRVIMKKDRKGKTVITKDKSDEKKYLYKPDLLINRSSNYSDAFKYFICRPDWLDLASNKSSPEEYGDFDVF